GGGETTARVAGRRAGRTLLVVWPHPPLAGDPRIRGVVDADGGAGGPDPFVRGLVVDQSAHTRRGPSLGIGLCGRRRGRLGITVAESWDRLAYDRPAVGVHGLDGLVVGGPKNVGPHAPQWFVGGAVVDVGGLYADSL